MVRRRFFSAVSNHEATVSQFAGILREQTAAVKMQPPFAPQDEG
jgi:hypothetical protein